MLHYALWFCYMPSLFIIYTYTYIIYHILYYVCYMYVIYKYFFLSEKNIHGIHAIFGIIQKVRET